MTLIVICEPGIIFFQFLMGIRIKDLGKEGGHGDGFLGSNKL